MVDADLHPAIVAQRRRSRDIAYGCFLYFGLMFATAWVLNRIPTHWLVYRALATVLSLPVVMAGFVVAAIVGIGFSVRAWREWPLLLLTLLTAVMPLMLVGVARFEMTRSWPGTMYFFGYTLLALALPLWWFFGRRRAWTRSEA